MSARRAGLAQLTERSTACTAGVRAQLLPFLVKLSRSRSSAFAVKEEADEELEHLALTSPPGHVPKEEQRLTEASIIGVPNAGKSTLINHLVGSKVSAVSNKTNTTFVPILGGFTEGYAQVILHDTPGVVDSRHHGGPDQARRVKSAWTTARDADILLLVIDAHRQITARDARVTRLVEELASGKHTGSQKPPPTVLLLNKVDKLRSRGEFASLSSLGDELAGLCDFERVLHISAAVGDGLSDLKRLLLDRARQKPWVLEPEQATNLPQASLATEIVREKIFRRLRQELPYELDVVQTEAKSFEDSSLLLKHDILVPSETVRRMVIGKKGCVVGEIGLSARKELEQLLNRKVHLYISVRLGQR